jgi:oxygen-dependent protoporphyrinogen oxidase
MAPDVLVVGGGVAGLVAARRLALAGRRVTVFEASPRFGGQVARVRIDGTDLDAGAESFATRGDTVARLLDELGLGDDVVAPTPAPAWLYTAAGTAAPLPATGLLGVPAGPLAADVVRIVGRSAALRARLDAVLPARIGIDAATLGELVRIRMGRGILDALVAPVVRGIYSREPDDLRLDSVLPGLRDRLRELGSLAAAMGALRSAAPAGTQIAGIRGGMYRLVDALVEDCIRLGVDLVADAPLDEIEAGSVRLGGVRRTGTVLLAAPTPSESSRRVTLVFLLVPASPALDVAPRGTGLLVASGAPGVTARALTHVTAKWAWVADLLRGRHLLRLSYDEAPPSPLALAERDAAALLGTELGPVLAAESVTWDRVAGTAGPPTDGIPRVGEAVAGTGLASVVAQAEAVAAEIDGDSRGTTPRGRMEP